MYHITSEQIQTFLTLAQKKNYREASEILFITQPTATKHIQKLEKELDMTLFRRSTQGVELTEAGARLAEGWGPLYHRFFDVINEAELSSSKSRDELIISLLRDYRSMEFADRLRELFRTYLSEKSIPSVALRINFLSMYEQREALRHHQVDFSFSLGFDYGTLNNIETMILSRKPVHALLPKNHELANRSSLALQDLSAETFLILSSQESAEANDVTRTVLRKKLPEAKTRIVPNFQTMAYALSHNEGITLGNRHFGNFPDFVEIPVTDMMSAGYEETLSWRQDEMSTGKIVFLKFIRECGKELI